MNTARGGTGEGLVLLHTRLDEHFASLRKKRDAHASGIPIFALEHGLSGGELGLLKAELCSALHRRHLPRDSWLPFIVYASEIGYDYSGDEYWQTFELRTPGWAEHGDRHYIRRKFREFKDRFQGAEPTGPWARHFSIICWPITHAVLPTDLQRHLARLLFEYRRALTGDLLTDPEELGRRLAARAWQASSRFQNFAQNTALLGQVAAALLVGDDEESPYLLDSTLRRIVSDLSAERETRRWLVDAKSTAIRVRARGFRPPERNGSGGRTPSQERLPVSTDPDVLLRRETEGWAVYVELPDLSVLTERLPSIHGELGRLRAHLAGVIGAPLARGRLLYPGQQLRLSEWPAMGHPLIQLENGSSAVNAMLSDQAVLSPGPRWLFRLREPGLGVEVRGKFVRPGHSYILLTREALGNGLPAWVTATACKTGGVVGYSVNVPAIVEPSDERALHLLGVGAITDVEVRPAGLVPALWDGEGSAEWIAGEDPLIAIRSSRAVVQAILTMDGFPSLLSWPTDNDEMFFRLSDLDAGSHELRVSLLSAEVDVPVAEGALTVLIRAPHTRPATGTFREGLMVIANPVSPTLDELWDARATLQVVGPTDARVRLDYSLVDRAHRKLASHRLTATLPIESNDWLQLLDRLRRVQEIQRHHDYAEACVVQVSHPDLGDVALRCDREFAPLRWAFGRDRDGPLVRLVDNTDGVPVSVQRFDFASPAVPIPVPIASDQIVRSPPGGLVVAWMDNEPVAITLPPWVRDLDDMRPAQPVVSVGPRSMDEVMRIIHLAGLWARAALPADPFAETGRRSVLRAIVRVLVVLVCGRRWARIEETSAREEAVLSVDDMAETLGDHPYQRELARAIRYRINSTHPLEPAKRVHSFAVALALHAAPAGVMGEDHRLSEFLLRLASDPSSLVDWPTEDVRHHLELTLVSPVLLRAARFLVLATGSPDSGHQGTAHEGWAWE